jgi:competence protein ComEC
MVRAMVSGNESMLHVRGLGLVLLTVAWLAGNVLASFFFTAASLAPFLPALEWILLLAAGVALLFAWLLRWDVPGRLTMLCVLCVSLGAWRYGTVLPGSDPQAISAFIGNRQLDIRGRVVDEPELQGWGSSRVFIVSTSSVSRDGGKHWLVAHGQLAVVTRSVVSNDPYEANYDDQVELTGKLQQPAPSTPAGIFASMAFPRVVVEAASTSLLAQLYNLRASLATVLDQLLPQPEAALLIAILLGWRTPELKPFASSFSVTGTAHLIASSGFKVTILVGLITNSMQWLQGMGRRNRPRGSGWLAGPLGLAWKGWLSTLGVLCCVACYTILSGAGAAAIRAGIMGALLVVAPRLGRTYHAYNALAAAALTMTMIDPFIAWDVGFLLSFLGTLGIVLFTPHIQCRLAFMERGLCGRVISENISVTLAAQVATLPIMAFAFQNVSLISPLANVLTVPLLELLILLGICLCLTGFVFAPLAVLCAWVAWPLLWYVIHVVSWCAQVPYLPESNFSSVMGWSYYVVLITGYVWYVRRRLPAASFAIAEWPVRQQSPARVASRLWRIGQAGAACVLVLAMGMDMFITLHSNDFPSVTFLPVGLAKTQLLEGDAILVRTADHRTILIDGGLDAVSLSEQLDSRLPPWQRSLDLVVLTSPRRDHISGLLDIIQRYQVKDVIDAGMLHPDTTYALWRRNINERKLKYLQVAQGLTIPVGDVSLQILWPLSQLHKGSNEVIDNSMVIRLVLPGLHLLLLGAAAQSSYALQGLVSSLDAEYLRAEVVQIGGAAGKAAPATLEKILQQAHAQYLIVTPAARSARQSSSGRQSPPALPVSVREGAWRTIATAQVGAVEIDCHQHSWIINST